MYIYVVSRTMFREKLLLKIDLMLGKTFYLQKSAKIKIKNKNGRNQVTKNIIKNKN